MPPGARRHAAVLLGYALLALVLTWPLALHLGTHFTGPPSGDTGVYVWNLWVFQHEIGEGRLPFYTSSIFSLSSIGPVNLSLHNYTTFANLVAWPLIPLFGIVVAFNLVFLLNITLAGYGAYLLAHELSARDPEAWLAGALFAASPALVARGEGHFSLVAAAALPVFLLFLRRSLMTHELRYAVGAGVAIAWATFSDAYYGVFCVMMGAAVVLAQFIRVRRPSTDVPVPHILGARRIVNVLLLVVGSFVLALALRGGGPVAVFGIRISSRTLYTPVLVLSLLLLVRTWLALRPTLALRRDVGTSGIARVVAAGVVTMCVLLAPVLVAFGERVLSGNLDLPRIHWRSSPPGLDLAALVLPNPNHPVWGDASRRLIVEWSGRLDGFPEYVGSIPWIALVVLAAAVWRAGWRPAAARLAFTGFFTLLALGPFVQVLGVNTTVPTPWALLRYAPIVGMVRSPSRFIVIVVLAVAALFAMALVHLTRTYPSRRRAILAAVAAVMAVELLPAPRPLFSAAVPSIYPIIAADPRPDIRVLELPFGVRDGASSIGDFSALTQYYQTVHHKAIAGGYLSRVSARRKRSVQRFPVLHALMTLSEKRALEPADADRARAHVDEFLSQARLGYVVIDHTRASPELAGFASELLGLRQVAADGPRGLYVTRDPISPAAADPGGAAPPSQPARSGR